MATAYEVDVTATHDVPGAREALARGFAERLAEGTWRLDDVPGGWVAAVLVEADDVSVADRQVRELVVESLRLAGLEPAGDTLDVVVRSSS